jgi:hypothetical protein
MINWNLKGKEVKGIYFDIAVRGFVTDSRVKYGGKVQHTVKLYSPISLSWRDEPVKTILLDNDKVFFVSPCITV